MESRHTRQPGMKMVLFFKGQNDATRKKYMWNKDEGEYSEAVIGCEECENRMDEHMGTDGSTGYAINVRPDVENAVTCTKCSRICWPY